MKSYWTFIQKCYYTTLKTQWDNVCVNAINNLKVDVGVVTCMYEHKYLWP